MGGRVLPLFEAPRPTWMHDNLLGFLSVIDWYQELTELPQSRRPVGANILFNRAQLIEQGGFRTSLGRIGADTNNLLCGEETALIDRIREKGGRIFYVPDAQVTHCIPADRLTRAWMRRRAVWQAISDQMKHGINAQQALVLWPAIIDYLKLVPPEHTQLMGLLWDTDNPDIFLKQIQCLQFFSLILVSQGSYPPGM
jgi:hypothetical protein